MSASAHDDADSPERVFDVYRLNGISVSIAGSTVLAAFGFEPTWSRDHDVTAFLEDWKRAGSSIDA